MEMNEEYHDPDYPEVPVCVKEEVTSVTEDEKIAKIQRIVRREFRKELDARENEVALIDQRMRKARRYLHLLRYTLVNNYYTEHKLQMSSSRVEDEVAAQNEPRARAEVSSVLRDSQRSLHPSLRKLLGKKTVDMDEIFRSRAPRKKTKVNYSAMAHAKNVTISADTTKSLRPSTEEPIKSEEEAGCSSSVPRKVPRHLEPKLDNVLTLDGVTRNKQKHRYRIIIGNTSKYMPPASRADRSTHKWLLYVRGPPLQPDVSRVITSVTVRLHHSYAPHHIVVIDKPPFQLSRRGWGEFAAKITLEFVMPHCNRPATLTHTIKLDRNYTGLQTLGAETVADVWLYSTPDMLPFEYKTDQERIVKPDEQTDILIKDIKTEPNNEINESSEMSEISEQIDEISETKQAETDEWLNFFTNDTTEVNVDEMFIKNFKTETNMDETNQTVVKDAKTNQTVAKEGKLNQVTAKDCKVNQTLAKEIKTNQTNDNKGNQRIVKEGNFNQSTAKECEFNKSMNKDIKIEPAEDAIPNGNDENESNEIEAKPNELNSSKRIVKYMEPTTRKIYYLEVDRNLDLNKIQEIVINSQGQMKTAKVSPNRPGNGLRFVRKKKGQSLLRPDIKNQLVRKPSDEQSQIVISTGFEHIRNDHCYIANDWLIREENSVEDSVEITKDYLKDIRSDITRLACPRVIVSYLLKKIPVISENVRDVDFGRTFPFVVDSHERYWKYDFAKRRNIEWSRAKLINKLLSERFQNDAEKIWRTKQILVFSRLHGYYPVRPETVQRKPEHLNLESNDWSSWYDLENSRKSESNIRELYPRSSDLCSLTLYDLSPCNQDSSVDLCESDEEIDIVSDTVPVKKKSDVVPECDDSLTALPVSSEDRLRFLFIERMCTDIGIELRNEDVGNGHSYSAVHSVLLTAVKCFAEEMIRAGLADQLAFANDPLLPSVWIGSSTRSAVRLEHVYRGAQRTRRLRALCTPAAVAPAPSHDL